jgi:pyruvate dehydrogenase E2 component (dihydrolipoamide acetyltransferase)
MRVEFRLPSLGADMESAVLTQWLKKQGDTVRRGEAIAVVETAKGLIDIEVFDDGTMEEIMIVPGTKVPVGAVLARIDSVTATAVPSTAPQGTTEAAVGGATGGPMPPTLAAPESVAPALGPARQRVSPAARRRAHELGIALETLGRVEQAEVIHVADIEKLAAHPERPVPGPHSAMRAAIGAAMARSKREIPHYYLGHAVDFTPAREWLLRYNSQVPVADRLIEGVLLVKAVALAVARIEGFNGFFREGRFEPSAAVHVGTAIALRGGGLVAPALLDANQKDLATLMREFSDLVTRVRSGHMRSGEFAAGTITVTNLGSDGVDVLYPIINPPQVAIVGAGSVAERPWVCGGALSVRSVLTLTLAGDHRVTDGRAGSHFLKTIAEILTVPERL